MSTPGTPLGCPKRKKEDPIASPNRGWSPAYASPLNDHNNPSLKRVRVIPPPNHPDPLPPINLMDYGVNTHIPAQKEQGHPWVYVCASCGLKQSHVLMEASSNLPKEIWQAEAILAALHEQHLMIGQFFAVILDPKNEDRLTQNSQSVLAAFLQGWTISGTQPIDVVKLMFCHHLSQDRLNDIRTAYHPPPIYACCRRDIHVIPSPPLRAGFGPQNTII